jgi:hypothetical protein
LQQLKVKPFWDGFGTLQENMINFMSFYNLNVNTIENNKAFWVLYFSDKMCQGYKTDTEFVIESDSCLKNDFLNFVQLIMELDDMSRLLKEEEPRTTFKPFNLVIVGLIDASSNIQQTFKRRQNSVDSSNSVVTPVQSQFSQFSKQEKAKSMPIRLLTSGEKERNQLKERLEKEINQLKEKFESFSVSLEDKTKTSESKNTQQIFVLIIISMY